MPNRILKDSICSSDNLERLSQGAEIFFYRLIVQCDDYGLMDARPAILLAKCFPLKMGRVMEQDISAWMDELQQAQIIECYQVDGRPFLHFVKWTRHQQIRAGRMKYPPPSPDINGNQMISGDISCLPNPIQSNPIRIQKDGAHGAQPSQPSDSEKKFTAELAEKSGAKAIRADLPSAVRVFLDNGGRLPTGKLGDGTRKADKAIEIITAQVRSTPEELEFWAKVVEAYCMVWSPKSYTVMLNEFYARRRIPGQSSQSGNGSNGFKPAPKRVLKDA